VFLLGERYDKYGIHFGNDEDGLWTPKFEFSNWMITANKIQNFIYLFFKFKRAIFKKPCMHSQ
jgi:hypothetical protein